MIAVVILGSALLASFVNVASIPSWGWYLMDEWIKVSLGVNVVSLVATLLVAFYVYRDCEKSDTGNRQLLKRIKELEGVVDKNGELIDKRLKALETSKRKAEHKPKQKQAIERSNS
jgi:hypothetical protein